jgi:hypothetical protein
MGDVSLSMFWWRSGWGQRRIFQAGQCWVVAVLTSINVLAGRHAAGE